MKLISATSTLLSLSLSLTNLLSSTDGQVVYPGCDPSTYYASLGTDTTLWTEDQLRALVTDTKANVLVLAAQARDEEDVTAALIDIWPGDVVNSTVRLIYKDTSAGIQSANTPETWSIEHLWPLDRGIPFESEAVSDMHMKAAIRSTVKLAKGELFFGECGTVQALGLCDSPATPETAPTSAEDGKIFTPPINHRGDVARALFYAALRYSNDLGLSLTDCPPFLDGQFGYLTPLLKWHLEDPVDDVERARNSRVCERWQGNRNPFVDHEFLVKEFFGDPDTIQGRQYKNCVIDTVMPTATPNACSDLGAGDMIAAVVNTGNGDDLTEFYPDEIQFFAVAPIPSAVGELYMTDKPWTGTGFGDGEGIVRYPIPEGGIPARSTLGYGVQFPGQNDWELVDGVFELNLAGDNFFVYCLDADSLPVLLSGTVYGPSDPAVAFVAEGLTSYAEGETALPASLAESNGIVLLPTGLANHGYEGPSDGNQATLLGNWANETNWGGSNLPYIIVTSGTARTGSAVLVTTALLTVIMTTMWLV